MKYGRPTAATRRNGEACEEYEGIRVWLDYEVVVVVVVRILSSETKIRNKLQSYVTIRQKHQPPHLQKSEYN